MSDEYLRPQIAPFNIMYLFICRSAKCLSVDLFNSSYLFIDSSFFYINIHNTHEIYFSMFYELWNIYNCFNIHVLVWIQFKKNGW